MFRQPSLLFVFSLLVAQAASAQSDPLPSWHDSDAKRRVTDFVQCVTKDGCKDFVPPAERIAVFDNDGTLWCEQPMYVQLAFVLDRVKALAPQHPEWKEKEPFAAVLRGDAQAVAATGEKGIAALLAATHAGMTSEEFEKIATDWIATARHPKFKRPYTECVYQPMLELLAYLRANDFKDLHRLRRRHRIHATLGGQGLRHSAGASDRFVDQAEV